MVRPYVDNVLDVSGFEFEGLSLSKDPLRHLAFPFAQPFKILFGFSEIVR